MAVTSVHQYKVGDKVRIKKLESGTSNDYPLCFAYDMGKRFSGQILTIDRIGSDYLQPHDKELKFYNGDNNGYKMKEDFGLYNWHSSMFEPVESIIEEQQIHPLHTDLHVRDHLSIGPYIGTIVDGPSNMYYLYFNDHNRVCYEIGKDCPVFRPLAKEFGACIWEEKACHFPHFKSIENLYRYCIALNEEVNKNLQPFKEGDEVFLGGQIYAKVFKYSPDFYYLNLTHNSCSHTEMCKKLSEIVPEYRELAKEYRATWYKKEDCNIPIFSNLKDLFSYYLALSDRVNKALHISQTQKTTNKHDEIRFQKPKGTFVRGSVPIGHPISGRRHKVTVAVGHLSNKTISC